MMKTLHMPFHFHRAHQGHTLSEQLHTLMQNDRFGLVAATAIVLGLILLIVFLGMQYSGTYTAPIHYWPY